MDSVARFVSRIIYFIERGGTSSTKKYNDLKQRLMEIWDETFIIYLIIQIYLEIFRKN